MPQFEIHWLFLAWVKPAECWEMVADIRRIVPELVSCVASVTDNQEPPNQIKLKQRGRFTDQPTASRFAVSIKNKVLANLGCLRSEYHQVVGVPSRQAGTCPN